MNVWDKLYVRDFLIACLMVIGGGHRSDVIRNMTLEEWNDRKMEEGDEEENQVLLKIKMLYNVQEDYQPGQINVTRLVHFYYCTC